MKLLLIILTSLFIVCSCSSEKEDIEIDEEIIDTPEMVEPETAEPDTTGVPEAKKDSSEEATGDEYLMKPKGNANPLSGGGLGF